MAISAAINQKGNMHLADEPILLKIDELYDSAKISIQIETVGINNTIKWITLYSLFVNPRIVTNRYDYSATVDISDVVRSAIPNELSFNFDDPLGDYGVSNFDSYPYLDYYVLIEKDNESSQMGPFRAFRGGISDINNDLSDFINGTQFDNFLNILTSRTISKNIVLKECEISPLHIFSKPNINYVLIASFGEKDIRFPIYRNTEFTNKLRLINIAEIRKKFLEDYDFFPSKMDFYLESDENMDLLCSLTIEDNNTPNPIVLRFKNSFGVYERKALDPAYEIETKFEKSTHQVFNDNNYKLYKNSPRSTRVDVMKASLRINSMDENIFALDILHSDDVFLEHAGKVQPVVVSTDSIVRRNNFKPFTINLTIEPKSTDLFAPLDFNKPLPATDHRVFDATFDETFR